MRWLYFMSRLAFVSNIAFILCLVLRYRTFMEEKDLVATLLILGWLMPLGLNAIVNTTHSILFVAGKRELSPVPQWLITTNALFFIVQAYLFFIA